MPDDNKVQVKVYLKASEHARLKKLAVNREITMSAVIAELVMSANDELVAK